MQRVIVASVLFAAFMVASAGTVFRFRCGDCGRIEEFSDNSGSHYCYGTTEHPHSKRLMEYLGREDHRKSTKYRCPDCGRIETYDGENGTDHFCVGSKEHPHQKRQMERLGSE